ncbi:MAG: hypothetical protein Q8O55_10275 [Dehalococcoidales bacterium]|nr:hypothetical protein [Dehalococcoidales bacterium]
MRKRLWLTAILLVIVVLLAGCAGHPKGMKSLRWLTDAEKEKVTEIALNTPEAVQAKNNYGTYTTSLDWVAIDWHDHAFDSFGIDYDYQQPESQKWISEHVPKSAEFYSEVIINFGEPPQLESRVAINPDTGKVANIQQFGLKLPPYYKNNQ